MRKIISALAAAALIAGTCLGVTAVTAGVASADPCTGVWSIGVGGLTIAGPGITGQDSGYINANQRVGYNSTDINAGVGELNHLVLQHRSECPGDHIMILAHSGGALVAHRWIAAAQSFPNLNAVLLADPARAAGPGGPGFASAELGWFGGIYSGTDANFGSIPVLEICNHNDHICDSNSDWVGYLTGAHNAYDFNATSYGLWDSGVVFQ